MNIPSWVENLKRLLNVQAGNLPPVYVWGPPATGKTFLCLNVFPGREPVAITLHRGQPVEELRGMYVPSGNGFEWRDGPIIEAMKNGRTLLINEMGEASDDVLSLLYAVLDRPESCAYTLPNGETIRPVAGFRVIATGNTNPSDLPEAIRSRFPIQFHAVEPNPESVANLPEHMRDAAVATMSQGERSFDPRRWQAWNDLSMIPGIGAELAFDVVFGEDAQALRDACAIANKAGQR